MDAIIRAAFIYFFLLLIMRVAGKRQLSELTTFDLVLTIIIAEAVQQGLLGQDFSVTYAALTIVTLVGIDIVLSFLKYYSKGVEKVLDDVPTILIDDGRMVKENMRRNRVDEQDILSQARISQGIARMEDVRYAILEPDGKISIIPAR